MFESRWGIRAYDYRQGYTIAQIELMAVDQPLVVYAKDKDRKKPLTASKANDIADAWEKKRKEKGSVMERIKLSEWFSADGGGAKAGGKPEGDTSGTVADAEGTVAGEIK